MEKLVQAKHSVRQNLNFCHHLAHGAYRERTRASDSFSGCAVLRCIDWFLMLEPRFSIFLPLLVATAQFKQTNMNECMNMYPLVI